MDPYLFVYKPTRLSSQINRMNQPVPRSHLRLLKFDLLFETKNEDDPYLKDRWSEQPSASLHYTELPNYLNMSVQLFVSNNKLWFTFKQTNV